MMSREMLAYGLLILAAAVIAAAVAWRFLAPSRRRERGRERDENLYYNELRKGRDGAPRESSDEDETLLP